VSATGDAVLAAVALLGFGVVLLSCSDGPASTSAPSELAPPADIDPLVARAIEPALDRVRQSGDPAAFGELGRVYHANKFFDLARRCYEIAAAGDDERPEWPYYLGILALERGRTTEATERLRQAIRRDPDYAPAYLRLADALLDDGEDEAALAAYRDYARREPNDAWGELGLGRLARRRGDDDEALRRFERASTLDPELAEAAYLLATTYRATGRNTEADRAFEQFSRLGPSAGPPDPRLAELEAYATGAQVKLRRAATALSTGRLGEAEAIYVDVLVRNPNEYAARVNLGIVYFGQRRLDDAERELLRATTIHPRNPYAHYGLARCMMARSRFAEAEDALLRVLDLDPDHAEARDLLVALRARSAR